MTKHNTVIITKMLRGVFRDKICKVDMAELNQITGKVADEKTSIRSQLLQPRAYEKGCLEVCWRK